jgi:hypothetical protein
MMSLIVKWLHQKLALGIYRGPFRRLVERCERLTLNRLLKRRVQTILGLPDTDTPEWVSEIYQLLSLGIAIALLILARFAAPKIVFIVALIALYRPLEIFLFILNWVFVHSGPLHSYKRSLAGFMLNLVEVVIFYAAVYIGFGCMVPDQTTICTALYSSVRISVTIGPVAMGEPPACTLCTTLIVTQVVVSYLLIVVSIANVVGSLRKRGQKGEDQKA